MYTYIYIQRLGLVWLLVVPLSLSIFNSLSIHIDQIHISHVHMSHHYGILFFIFFFPLQYNFNGSAEGGCGYSIINGFARSQNGLLVHVYRYTRKWTPFSYRMLYRVIYFLIYILLRQRRNQFIILIRFLLKDKIFKGTQ